MAREEYITKDMLETNQMPGSGSYKSAYCKFQSCCEDCDWLVRFGCKLIRNIEDLQDMRILKICKGDNLNV